MLAPLWRHIAPDGVIGLGSAGAATVAAVSTVNFALRSPDEQDALAAAYGRWLNSLTGPVQILVRAGRADLSAAVAALREAAPALPHPALEQAALEHARFLDGLAAERDVLTRQALLILREPGHGTGRPGGGTAGRALQRAGEAARLLSGAGLQVQVLDGGQVTALPTAPSRMIAVGQHQFSTTSGNYGNEPEISGISPRLCATPDPTPDAIRAAIARPARLALTCGNAYQDATLEAAVPSPCAGSGWCPRRSG